MFVMTWLAHARRWTLDPSIIPIPTIEKDSSIINTRIGHQDRGWSVDPCLVLPLTHYPRGPSSTQCKREAKRIGIITAHGKVGSSSLYRLLSIQGTCEYQFFSEPHHQNHQLTRRLVSCDLGRQCQPVSVKLEWNSYNCVSQPQGHSLSQTSDVIMEISLNDSSATRTIQWWSNQTDLFIKAKSGLPIKCNIDSWTVSANLAL